MSRAILKAVSLRIHVYAAPPRHIALSRYGGYVRVSIKKSVRHLAERSWWLAGRGLL